AHHKGRCSGSFGTLSCISLNPMKVFAACGEAGVVVLDEEKLYQRGVALRYNGQGNPETWLETSPKRPFDTFQAPIPLYRMSRVEALIERRRRNASFYAERLVGLVAVPIEREGEFDVYYTFTIRSSRRDELKAFLDGRGIETKIQHPLLMPDQPAYRDQVRGE